MQYLVTGYDGTDAGAPARRLAAREAHLSGVTAAAVRGEHLYAAALLDEAGNMVGSTLVVSYADREALDAWLAQEPYVVSGVWERVTVTPCRVAPMFAK